MLKINSTNFEFYVTKFIAYLKTINYNKSFAKYIMISVDTVPTFPLPPEMAGIEPAPSQAHESESTLSATKSTPITLEVFNEYLDTIGKELKSDPFLTIGRTITFTSGDGCYECRTSIGKWNSSTFGKDEPGDFRYIKVFEKAKKGLNKIPLIDIRISQDHQIGEWIGIHKGSTLSGTKVVALAEKISRTVRIKKCFLTDGATVSIPKSGKIALRIPLWIIKGQGFYNPLFSLADGSDEYVKGQTSNSARSLNQDTKKFQRKLTWLQNVTVADLHNKILTKSPADQKALKKLVPEFGTITLQELMKGLYDKKATSRKAMKDYYWACHRLLTHIAIKGESDLQRKYRRATKYLDVYMLHVANFG